MHQLMHDTGSLLLMSSALGVNGIKERHKSCMPSNPVYAFESCTLGKSADKFAQVFQACLHDREDGIGYCSLSDQRTEAVHAG